MRILCLALVSLGLGVLIVGIILAVAIPLLLTPGLALMVAGLATILAGNVTNQARMAVNRRKRRKLG